MLKLGIIGTNWITQQFVDAATNSGEYELAAVYSRRAETAQQFADEAGHKAALFTDLDAFFGSDTFDTVYIASPNIMHADQTVAAVNAGKNVIVEKPMVTSLSQLDAVLAVQKAHPDAFIFEAARHLYEPNFAKVSEYTHSHKICGATLTYMKYSSRYDAFLAGKTPNVFTTKFAGGALEDLGVYLVYAALSWFGVPEDATYVPTKLTNGIDGTGVLHLTYPDFGVNLTAGKTTQSYLPSEIYFGRDTLVVDAPESISSIKLYSADTKPKETAVKPDKNPMIREARFFANAINQKDYAARDEKLVLAKHVHTVISQARVAAGIVFPSDK